jgi:hypothetical protein
LVLGNLWECWQSLEKQGKNRSFHCPELHQNSKDCQTCVLAIFEGITASASGNDDDHTPFPFMQFIVHRAIPQRWPTCWPSLSLGHLWQSWPPLQKQGKNRTFRGSGAVQDPIDGQTLSVGHLWTITDVCSGNDHAKPPLPFMQSTVHRTVPRRPPTSW